MANIYCRVLEDLEKKRTEKDEIVAKVPKESAKDKRITKLICQMIEKLKAEDILCSINSLTHIVVKAILVFLSLLIFNFQKEVFSLHLTFAYGLELI